MIVFGSPRRYVQGPGVVALIGAELVRLGRSAIFVAEEVIWQMVSSQITSSCQIAGVAGQHVRFGGEVTRAEIDRLYAACADNTPDIVVAIGGGKTIDASKALCNRLHARMVTMPTIASNDSPTSHIFVIYDEDHCLVAVERMSANPDLVIVDTAIITKAPAILLSAGIGDGVVKLFEVEQCYQAGSNNVFGGRGSIAALALARACHDTLRRDGPAALAAVARGTPDAALENVVEACVLMSGLAFENGGLSICHAMTRGLSAVKGPAEALHGLQVAYGLLVQLELERRDATFIDDMRIFFKATGLPLSLRELGFAGTSADILTIAELTTQAPHAKNFHRLLGAEDVVAAIQAVETGRHLSEVGNFPVFNGAYW
jgi:glycerol dehydrogenase